MLGPFTKPAAVNPVITPDASSRFHSPLGDSAVAWEAYATFNPAAVVRGGTLFLLYRAEDASGEQQIGGHTSRLGLAESGDGLRFARHLQIGGHTSRLGLAESGDGLRFARHPTPVLYPDTDAQRQNE